MQDDTLSLMGRSLACMNRFIANRLRESGLEGIVPSHGDILVLLFQKDELPMGEIAAHIAREPSTTTALVRKLEEFGYVSTRRDGSDRRVVLVQLTAKGRSLEPTFQDISTDVIAISKRGIPDCDWQTMRWILAKIQENFKEEDLR